jgi:hypothetical protein
MGAARGEWILALPELDLETDIRVFSGDSGCGHTRGRKTPDRPTADGISAFAPEHSGLRAA